MSNDAGSWTPDITRRGLLRAGAAGLATLAGTAAAKEGTARSGAVPAPSRPHYIFPVTTSTLDPDGQKPMSGVTVGGSFPGPEVRIREGDQLRIRVENRLSDSPTSVHWHGLLLPAGMDGVPDVSNAPIAAERVYVYEYPILQSGTYWYHSHYQLQEQVGLFGPFVIEPREPEGGFDRDAVVMLSDWLHSDPDEVVPNLRRAAAKKGGMKGMDDEGPDLSDVDYDAFLLNGKGNQAPWSFSAAVGERIRLRIINAGASTYFRVMLDGHPLQITHADGLAVQPVTVDNVLMGMAECYDAVVTLSEPGSYTLHAVAQDGSGQALGVLHTPDFEPKPTRGMPAFGPKQLSYAMLRAPGATLLPEGPDRRIRLILGGDMAKYAWTLNGQVYPDADPLLVRTGERVHVEMTNKTGMWHPMHLHGHFFRVLQGAGPLCPLKHTVNVAPGETVRIEFTADNPGDWIFHCHNLYHLEAGMARVFEYQA